MHRPIHSLPLRGCRRGHLTPRCSALWPTVYATGCWIRTSCSKSPNRLTKLVSLPSARRSSLAEETSRRVNQTTPIQLIVLKTRDILPTILRPHYWLMGIGDCTRLLLSQTTCDFF